MIPFIENSRKCKLIYNDRPVISQVLEKQGGTGERDSKGVQGNFYGR